MAGWGRRLRGGLVVALLVGTLGGWADAAPAPPRRPAAPAPHRVAPATAPSPAAYEAGLSTATSTTYRLDPAGGAVHVNVRITLTNTQPDVVRGSSTRQYFVDRFAVPVLAEADGLAASREGRALNVTRVHRDGGPIASAQIDLVPNLFYRATQTLDLAYRLPTLPPRGEGFSRVNAAFVTFPAFGVGDPGATDIEVIVPSDLEVELVGSPMERSEEGDVTVYRALDIADPDTFVTSIVARDDEALVSLPVTMGDHSLTVLGWPGDEEWASFVADKVERGVPALEELVGLPWPGEDDLEVIETASPYLYGYAGWYLPSESLVEIGDELDAEVILHELSHLWFNDRLFADRWINEGLAEVYAAFALDRLGEPVTPPSPVDPADAGRIALVDWTDPNLTEPISEVQETYGYNTSHAVLHRIAEEIGVERLAQVIVAADSREVAYDGDGKPLLYSTAPNWQALLDLLEYVGGSTQAIAAFADLVASEDLQPRLDERAAARSVYDDLIVAGEGWTAPRVLRRAMAEWRFDSAGPLVAVAHEILTVKAEVADILEPVDVAVPAALEDAYEGAADPGDLAVADDEVADAATAVAEAIEAKRGAAGPLALLGGLGGDAASRLADAEEALDDGEYESALADGQAARDMFDGAAQMGAVRLLVLVLLVAATALRARRRAHRRQRAAGQEVETGAVDEAMAGPGATSIAILEAVPEHDVEVSSSD